VHTRKLKLDSDVDDEVLQQVARDLPGLSGARYLSAAAERFAFAMPPSVSAPEQVPLASAAELLVDDQAGQMQVPSKQMSCDQNMGYCTQDCSGWKVTIACAYRC